jgi:hypothetical protein
VATAVPELPVVRGMNVPCGCAAAAAPSTVKDLEETVKMGEYPTARPTGPRRRRGSAIPTNLEEAIGLCVRRCTTTIWIRMGNSPSMYGILKAKCLVLPIML